MHGPVDPSSPFAVQNFALVPVGNVEAAAIAIGVALALAVAAGLARLAVTRIAPTCFTPTAGPIHFIRLASNHPWAVDAAVALLVYLPATLVLTLSDSYISDSTVNRFAWVGLGQFLAATVFGVHFSPFALVVDRARLLLWHKFLARAGVVLVATHMAVHLNNWISADFVAEQLERPMAQFGLVAWIALALVAVLSVRVVRRWSYATFAVSHNFLFLVVSAFIVMHQRDAIVFVLPMVVVFLANKFVIAWQLVMPATVTVLASPVDPVAKPPHPLARSLSSGANTAADTASLETSTATASAMELADLSKPLARGASSDSIPQIPPDLVRIEITAAPFLAKLQPNHLVYLAARPASTFHPFSPRLVPPPAQQRMRERRSLERTTSGASSRARRAAVHRYTGSTASSIDSTTGAPVPPAAPLDLAPRAVINAKRVGKFTSALTPDSSLLAFVPFAPSVHFVLDFRQLVFVAGGVGITAVLAWIEYLAAVRRATPRHSTTSSTLDRDGDEAGGPLFPDVVQVVWVTRRVQDTSVVDWRAIEAWLPELKVNVYVTEVSGRPELEAVVPVAYPPTMGLVVGPESLVNAVRKLERAWWLQTEVYEW
ncbi:hypothetical protein H9P43_009031 [Blastocladiella emersonii ATCC 22665]|nr:hypothetical protein H9P43_009031 [Blastocladiella emersonii ATCC 22665]